MPEENTENAASSFTRLHAFVSGTVQGVSFRYYTMQEARQLGLNGFVRNLPDGRVEVKAEGDRETLEALVTFLYRGSPGASVRNVDVEWLEAENSFTAFDIR
jgi:acylphosphatase